MICHLDQDINMFISESPLMFPSSFKLLRLFFWQHKLKISFFFQLKTIGLQSICSFVSGFFCLICPRDPRYAFIYSLFILTAEQHMLYKHTIIYLFFLPLIQILDCFQFLTIRLLLITLFIKTNKQISLPEASSQKKKTIVLKESYQKREPIRQLRS